MSMRTYDLANVIQWCDYQKGDQQIPFLSNLYVINLDHFGGNGYIFLLSVLVTTLIVQGYDFSDLINRFQTKANSKIRKAVILPSQLNHWVIPVSHITNFSDPTVTKSRNFPWFARTQGPRTETIFSLKPDNRSLTWKTERSESSCYARFRNNKT